MTGCYMQCNSELKWVNLILQNLQTNFYDPFPVSKRFHLCIEVLYLSVIFTVLAKEESNTPKRDDTFSPLNEKNTNTNDMLKGSLNGMPSLSMNGDLRNENLANGYIDKEPVITGNCGNQKGLLPTPPLPPNVQHLLQNQMHGMPIPPVRALLPTPGSPQISSGIHVRPPLPPGYPVAPMQQENRPVPLKPRNGMIDENTLEGIKMKTEGLITRFGSSYVI